MLKRSCVILIMAIVAGAGGAFIGYIAESAMGAVIGLVVGTSEYASAEMKGSERE